MVTEDTFARLLERNYERWGDREVAFRDKDFGIWKQYTWKDSYESVKYFGLGLVSLGLQRGDKVAIIGDNEPEWYWAMFAIHAAGGVAVGMFTDAIPTEIQYIVDHSDSKFVVARDQEQVDKLLAIKENVPKVEKVIWWYYKGMRNYPQPFLMSFSQVVDLGRKYEADHPGAFEAMIDQGEAEDIANIYYTSGTTGLPKGAMCSHKALLGSTRAMLNLVDLSHKDNILCYLPPAWVGEAFFGFAVHLLSGAKMNTLEEPETIFRDIREVAPSLILGGPRQWEGWISMVQARIDEAGLLERLLYRLFLPVGLKVADLKLQAKRANVLLRALYRLADWMVFRPIRHHLGLTRTTLAATAGSVVGIDTFKFFHALGINLRQVYGSTEGGLVTGHHLSDIRVGTVGTALPGVEMKTSPEGEVLVRSDYIFSGFYKNPEATAAALRDGWWYSGDAGHIDDKGHLIYLDRVSEMVELRTGERFSPQFIESSLRFSSYITYAMVIGGTTRDYVSAIINIDFDNVGRWAERQGISYTTFTDLSQKPQVGHLVLRDVERVNRMVPPGSRIRKYVCLHKEFDPDEADLTRTRKLKRAPLEQRYGDLIEAMYEDKDECLIQATVVYQDGRQGIVTTPVEVYSVDTQLS